MWKHNFHWNYISPKCREDVELDDSKHSKAYVDFYAIKVFCLKNEILELGDPVDDLSVATVLMVVGGQLILLRPRKV